jgi:uncharacterized protein YbaP (TraB family)
MSTGPLDRLLRLLPLAALGVALAGPAPANAEPAAAAPTIDDPFLWQVDGGDKPSYLFGTIHGGVDAAELPPAVNTALSCSELFVMEATPGDSFHPAPDAQFPPNLPMDLVLAIDAYRGGTRVASLESMEFQLALLREVGGSEELAAMLADDSEAIEPLVDAYRTGDLDRISEVTQMGDPALRELLLTDRNHRWMRKLGKLLSRGGAFIAVGVGHCPGPDGLLDLLDQHGYSIRRLDGRLDGVTF